MDMEDTHFLYKTFSAASIRKKDLGKLSNWIRQGYCISLVGVSNIGKSLLLKSLLSPQIQKEYHSSTIVHPLIIFVDCHEVVGEPEVFYELVLRSIIDELTDLGCSSSLIDKLDNLHSKVLESRTEVVTRSYFARSINMVIREVKTPLFLILDEFDDAFEKLPAWTMRQLRSLYDTTKDFLFYVTSTSRRLEKIRSDVETYEFRELFHSHMLSLHPLESNDTYVLIDYFTKRYSLEIDSKFYPMIQELSGGHPGLIDKIIKHHKNWDTSHILGTHAVVIDLLTHWPLKKECKRLWMELDDDDREYLKCMVLRGKDVVQQHKFTSIEEKGLVKYRCESGYCIFSPIFERYIQKEIVEHEHNLRQGISLNPETGKIWIDGNLIKKQIGGNQWKLLFYLWQKAGEICDTDEIAEFVWGVEDGVSDDAVQGLITRLRKKIEKDPNNPKFIINIPGRGYRLEEVI
jgi:DNA-binding winged helix-turn-helix (wHTH) protein